MAHSKSRLLRNKVNQAFIIYLRLKRNKNLYLTEEKFFLGPSLLPSASVLCDSSTTVFIFIHKNTEILLFLLLSPSLSSVYLISLSVSFLPSTINLSTPSHKQTVVCLRNLVTSFRLLHTNGHKEPEKNPFDQPKEQIIREKRTQLLRWDWFWSCVCPHSASKNFPLTLHGVISHDALGN